MVFLIFDELPLAALLTPEQQVDARRLPNFDTATVAIHFEVSVTAMLSGLLPEEDKLPIYNDYPRNLFTLLAASHEIKAIEATTRLCPDAVCRAEDGTGFSTVAMWRDAGIVWLASTGGNGVLREMANAGLHWKLTRIC